jgi:hypothetical protein
MKVRILVRPTGLVSGQPWPKVGEVVDLPEHVADGMVHSGHVEPVNETPQVEKRPAPAKRVETRAKNSRKETRS